MKFDSRAGRYLLLCSLSFVLIMFGSRFVTLRFGQVFPEHSPADRNRIAALEARVQALDQRLADVDQRLHFLDMANERITKLENESQRLNEEIEAAKNVKPQIVYQRIAGSAHSPDKTVPKVAEMNKVPHDSEGEVVHKGDSRDKVRRVFGRPKSVLEVGNNGEVWNYEGVKSVTFNNDNVVSWDDMPIEP